MLKRLQARTARRGKTVDAQVMDARELTFADASFDAIVMHLIVAVRCRHPSAVSPKPRVC
jgi:ubiquinone/menaquinone biosynthesis C-methylase UbiE